jgi:transglutaminase-like putative cysteine protease
MSSYLDYRYGDTPSAISLRQALRFDAQRNPRTIALARQWAAEDPNPEAVIGKAIRLFNREFRYTLEPPPLDGNDPYDTFLFETHEGFCEHYAGTFTLLMRAAGIPARVVTGYQGGEVNPINHELIVRQADAHAWSEVWLQGQGWRRIDPTGVVSPIRLEGGVNAALGPIGTAASLIAADRLGVLSMIRFAWHAANSQWDNWVVNYNVDKQRDFFSRLGMSQVDWRTLALALFVVTLAIAAVISAFLFAREGPPRRDAALRAWQRFCTKLADAGLARAPHEGPIDYRARVVAQRPQWREGVDEITELYVQARYGTGASKDEERRLARLVKTFRAAG